MFFKSLIVAFLFVCPLASAESEGWFPVEKKNWAEGAEDGEEDSEVWILFYKKLDPGMISIRFPLDPSYDILDEGGFWAQSEKEGEMFTLVIQKQTEGKEGVADRTYELDGKWIQERVIQKQGHEYILRTESSEPKSGNHIFFVSSFSIQ